MKEVTKNEFWKFIGIIIVALPMGKGGENLWDKGDERQGFTEPINFGPSKFNAVFFIKKYICINLYFILLLQNW